jgi:hemerythrin-like domain-containing protein
MGLRQRPESAAIDPIALLKREHEQILKHLRMIDAIVDLMRKDRRQAGPADNHLDRLELAQAFRFFTGRVGIHFRREAILISTLARTLGHGLGTRQPFADLLREHRELRAEAVRIVKALTSGSGLRTPNNGADPFGIKAFIKQIREHLSCEERILYVLAGSRLTAKQKYKVRSRMLQI